MVMVVMLVNPEVVGRVKAKVASPRSFAPSWSLKVAVTTPEGAEPAVNVKLRLAAAPPWTSAPMLAGPLGEVTPLVTRRVATRLMVSAAPALVKVNEAVTVSPLSRVPLAGETLSVVRFTAGTRMSGAGFKTVEMAEAELFAELPSEARLETFAVLVTEPATSVFSPTEIVALELAGNVPTLATITPLRFETVP